MPWALLLAATVAQAQEATPVTGRVVAAGVGEPVSGAVVRAVCHAAVTTTGADGSWRLPALPRGDHQLVVEHLGYAGERISVRTPASSSIVVDLTPKPLSLEALVITASRRTQELKDVAIATEVVSAPELRASGSTDLAAVLVERTGVSPEGGHPVGSGVMLQGLGSERVLVLIDGQPVPGRISGKLDLSRLPVAMIERVEVVKGPQSTLYGSEAMGGVVNVITRAPERGAWRGGADVIGGSRNRLDLNASAFGGLAGAGVSVEAGRRTIELVPGHDGESGTYATRWDGALRIAGGRDSAAAWHAGLLVLEESQRWRTGALYNFADNLQWGARAGATLRRGAFVFSPGLYVTEFRHLSRRSTLPRALEGTGEAESQRLFEAEVLASAAFDRVVVDGGVEMRRDAIHSDRVTAADRALHTVEPFVQATIGGERWSVVPGARLSWSEQWGAHATPRVAVLYRPIPGLALRAAVGQGFRAPSFKELYMEFLNTGAGAGYRVRGNEALQPESSSNLTGSVEWAQDRFYARAQFFVNQFDDFIETVELADSSGLRLFTYDNIDDGMTAGSELEFGATWRGFRAEAGYAYLVAEDRRTGAKLPGRPAHSARASLNYAHPVGLRATLTGVHTGATTVNATTERGAFTRFDVRLAQRLAYGLELSAGIDNIGNTKPEHWPGFASRQVHLGLGWQVGQDTP